MAIITPHTTGLVDLSPSPHLTATAAGWPGCAGCATHRARCPRWRPPPGLQAKAADKLCFVTGAGLPGVPATRAAAGATAAQKSGHADWHSTLGGRLPLAKHTCAAYPPPPGRPADAEPPLALRALQRAGLIIATVVLLILLLICFGTRLLCAGPGALLR